MGFLGHGSSTVVEWLSICREVCSLLIENEPLMIGTDESAIKIDENFFRGRQKYGSGCMLEGDRVPQGKLKREKKWSVQHLHFYTLSINFSRSLSSHSLETVGAFIAL